MQTPELNLDPKEIQQFNAQAKSWWDPNGPCQPLHDINPVRFQLIQQVMPELDFSKTVLDIGCGGGILTELLAQTGAHTIGLDASPDLIHIAREHAKTAHTPALQIDYQITTLEEFEQQTDLKFDLITCLELLEHVPDPAHLIKTAATLLKPNGWFIVSTINRTLSAYLQVILAGEYILKILPKNTHQYHNFIKPSELEKSLRDADLTVVQFAGLRYIPFIRHASLIQNCGVNYFAIAQKQI